MTIRIGNDRNVLRQSKLIDTTPDSYSNTLTDFKDAPLAVGRTFTDGNVAITTQSIAGGVATVGVTWGGPAPDTQPPSAPANLVRHRRRHRHRAELVAVDRQRRRRRLPRQARRQDDRDRHRARPTATRRSGQGAPTPTASRRSTQPATTAASPYCTVPGPLRDAGAEPPQPPDTPDPDPMTPPPPPAGDAARPRAPGGHDQLTRQEREPAPPRDRARERSRQRSA